MEINLEVIEDLGNQYYPFAYALIPDDLMAAQLLIDGMAKTAVIIAERTDDGIDNERDIKKDLETLLIRHIFELSHRRNSHFKGSFHFEKAEGPFFSLALKQRALLFLRDFLKMTPTEIYRTLELEYEDILGTVHSARSSLLSRGEDSHEMRGERKSEIEK